MRRAIASFALSVVGLALEGCGAALQRQWPIWSNGDIYNNLYFQPGSR